MSYFEHMQSRINGYYVSTNYTFDSGLETMVFPYDDKCVHFNKPVSQYTRHYSNERSAREGHKATIYMIRKGY